MGSHTGVRGWGQGARAPSEGRSQGARNTLSSAASCRGLAHPLSPASRPPPPGCSPGFLLPLQPPITTRLVCFGTRSRGLPVGEGQAGGHRPHWPSPAPSILSIPEPACASGGPQPRGQSASGVHTQPRAGAVETGQASGHCFILKTGVCLSQNGGTPSPITALTGTTTGLGPGLCLLPSALCPLA